jgi:hypothetical protein
MSGDTDEKREFFIDGSCSGWFVDLEPAGAQEEGTAAHHFYRW